MLIFKCQCLTNNNNVVRRTLLLLLLDHTAARSIIHCCHDTVVSLSVCLSVFNVVHCGAHCRLRGLTLLYRRVTGTF